MIAVVRGETGAERAAGRGSEGGRGARGEGGMGGKEIKTQAFT